MRKRVWIFPCSHFFGSIFKIKVDKVCRVHYNTIKRCAEYTEQQSIFVKGGKIRDVSKRFTKESKGFKQ